MMVLLALSLLAMPASARELHIVVRGETVESLAAELGDPSLADQIRELNGLDADQQPILGRLLRLPSIGRPAQQAYVRDVGGGGTAVLDGVNVSLSRGMCLADGTRVCTQADGFAALRIEATDDSGTHDDISLLPGTCVTVQGTSSRAGLRAAVVEVSKGSVSVRTEKDRPGTLAVLTRDGVMLGSQGTFRVTVEDEATRTEALSAPVAVFGAGAQVDLGARQGNRVEEGKVPGPPVDLLDEGSPIEPIDGAPLRWTDFSWVPVEDAVAYRIHLATDADFTEMLYQANLSGTPWAPPVLVLPYEIPGLWWRISAFDSLGFEGMPSVSHSLVIPTGVGE